ncbi:hypothetical protein BDB01DRAFT_840018, partial [Pilobolus umbonatus]
GLNLPSYFGPGVYTLLPGQVVTISPGGIFSFLEGFELGGLHTGILNLPAVSLPTLTLPNGATIPNFKGPGVYTYDLDHIFSIDLLGHLSMIFGHTSTSSSSMPLPIVIPTVTFPEVTLPGLLKVPRYAGPGIYTIDSSRVISIGPTGEYTYLVGHGFLGIDKGVLRLPAVQFPTATLSNNLIVPQYKGPGIYTIAPGSVIQISSNGDYKWLSGTGTDYILPSASQSRLSLPALIEPKMNFPRVPMPEGGQISHFTGDGIYSLSDKSIVSINNEGHYSYILGDDNLQMVTGKLELAELNLSDVTLTNGLVIPRFSGPGLYTISPGNVINIDENGDISWIEGGYIRLGSDGDGFNFPEITLPPMALPTLTLDHVTLSDYTGPGIYTPFPENVISIDANGVVNILQGGQKIIEGGQPGYVFTIPGLELPTLDFPTVTLPGDYIIEGYHGKGVYTVSPGNVIQVEGDGRMSFIQGGPSGAPPSYKPEAFVFPSFSFPKISLSDIKFPSISLPNSLANLPKPTVTSGGFIFPGFSFDAFSRRMEPAQPEQKSNQP